MVQYLLTNCFQEIYYRKHIKCRYLEKNIKINKELQKKPLTIFQDEEEY